MDRSAPTVAEAIRQTQPFASKRQEGFLALLLATEAVRRRVSTLLASQGDVTMQQYNVLRILRGAGAAGLPTLSIVERMIEHTPGITRLIDRLAAKGLATRDRAAKDRRLVVCRITPRGLDKLKALDPLVRDPSADVLSGLHDSEVATLVRLLNKVRTTQPREGRLP
jgi:DNA-binding MarR family transcriptional regulator